MRKIEIDCFEVIEAYDRSSTHVAYTSTGILAQEIVNKQRGYQSFHPYQKTIMIFESMKEVDNYSREVLRKTGLAKLSAEERQALGV